LIRRNNGIIIIDEITTGAGRTGKWYGYMHYYMAPDIIAMGKGIGNGYPVSITVMKAEIAEALEKNDFHHTQSHQNDPLGCAVVKEVIDTIQEEDLITSSRETGDWFLKEIQRLASKQAAIKEVRGRGLMLGIEFNESIEKDHLRALNKELFDRGFLVGYKAVANLFRFYPALTIKRENIKSMMENLEELIIKMLQQ